MKQTQNKPVSLWRTGLGRRAVSLLCAGALALTGVLPLSLAEHRQNRPG